MRNEVVKNGWFLVPFQKVPVSSCHALSLQDPNQTTNGFLPYLNRNCQLLTFLQFKSVYTSLWMMNYLPLYNSFPIDETSQFYPYSIVMFSGATYNRSTCRTSTAKIRHAIYTGKNHRHSLYIPLVRISCINLYFMELVPKRILLRSLNLFKSRLNYYLSYISS